MLQHHFNIKFNVIFPEIDISTKTNVRIKLNIFIKLILGMLKQHVAATFIIKFNVFYTLKNITLEFLITNMLQPDLF